jgi:hypothetical protein
MNNDALDTLLRQTDPYAGRSPLPDGAARAESAALVAEVVTTTRRRRARLLSGSRRRRLATIATALVIAVPTAAYAADRLLSHTGAFGTAGGGLQDSSEFINVCGSDIDTYVAGLAPTDFPAPPGSSWTAVATAVAKQARQECEQGVKAGAKPDIRTQETSLRTDILMRGSESWGCAAIRADVLADRAGVSTAREAMQAVAARINALDPGMGWTYTADIAIANSLNPAWVGGCGR